MEDYKQKDICVVGSLYEENNSTIQWTLKDFQKFFRMWTPSVVLRSPVFQMKDAHWILTLYFRTFNYEEALCVSVLRLSKYEIMSTTCHVVVLVEDYELGDFELGDYVRNMPRKKHKIYGPIRRTVNLRSRKTLNFRNVRVRCTFNKEFEGLTTGEISEDVPEQGNHSREKTEATEEISKDVSEHDQNSREKAGATEEISKDVSEHDQNSREKAGGIDILSTPNKKEELSQVHLRKNCVENMEGNQSQFDKTPTYQGSSGFSWDFVAFWAFLFLFWLFWHYTRS